VVLVSCCASRRFPRTLLRRRGVGTKPPSGPCAPPKTSRQVSRTRQPPQGQVILINQLKEPLLLLAREWVAYDRGYAVEHSLSRVHVLDDALLFKVLDEVGHGLTLPLEGLNEEA